MTSAEAHTGVRRWPEAQRLTGRSPCARRAAFGTLSVFAAPAVRRAVSIAVVGVSLEAAGVTGCASSGR